MTQASTPLFKRLIADPRRSDLHEATGIYFFVRDPDSGKRRVADIAELDRTSLLLVLRSRGGANAMAENVVAILLGHRPWSDPEDYPDGYGPDVNPDNDE